MKVNKSNNQKSFLTAQESSLVRTGLKKVNSGSRINITEVAGSFFIAPQFD